MMKSKTLITVLGWEDRYLKSNFKILDESAIDKIVVICFEDYLSMQNMEKNLVATIDRAKQSKIQLHQLNLEYGNSVNNWAKFEDFFKSIDESYVVNITTIPRETIWTIFFFLKKSSSLVSYAYFKPISYSETWLTRNHKNPRLLFKHSGVIDLQKKIALFIISGFDISRLDQIIDFYEPQKIIIFAQNGSQFENLNRNCDFQKYLEYYGNDIEVLPIDNYNVTESTELLKSKYEEVRNEFNVILDSQGPKVSSLSAYNAFLYSDNEIALAYVPVKDFNIEYSSGMDEEMISDIFFN